MNANRESHASPTVAAERNDIHELRLLNARQAAESLNISQRQVYDEVREGRLGAVRVGTRVLFRPSDLYDFVESRAVGAKR